MAAVGGDIKEVTYNHPTLGSGSFFPKAGEDSTYDLGGLRINDDANGIDGAGNAIIQMNMARWSFEIVISHAMNDREEAQKIKDLASNPQPADWTFSHINGAIYGGKGWPVGDLNFNGNAGTATLKVSGGGDLKRIP